MKFTKLITGDTVASGSGRAWKKLLTNLTPQLSAPTISLDGDTLTITDNSGLATSFDILVDGEVKYTYAKYLYNGVELPKIPYRVAQNYTNYWIYRNVSRGYYRLICSNSVWYVGGDPIGVRDTLSVTDLRYDITDEELAAGGGWTAISPGNYYYSYAEGEKFPLWSRQDILDGSATASSVFLEGTEPKLSETSLTKGTMDLSTLGLSAGTYSITVISKADGYADSAESEAVSYESVGDHLAGTWVFNGTITVSTLLASNHYEKFVTDYTMSSGSFTVSNKSEQYCPYLIFQNTSMPFRGPSFSTPTVWDKNTRFFAFDSNTNQWTFGTNSEREVCSPPILTITSDKSYSLKDDGVDNTLFLFELLRLNATKIS